MSFAKGTGQADFEERINFERLRKERIDKTIKQMKAHDLDAVFVWREENVRYLSSLRAQLLMYRGPTQSAAILTRDGTLVLFVSGGEIARIREAMPWISSCYAISMLEEESQVESFANGLLRSSFRDLGLLGSKIGIDAMTYNLMRVYQSSLGSSAILDGNQPLFDARETKTEDEIMILEEATAIADAVTHRGLESVKVGMREYDVVAESMHELYKLGGEFPHASVPFVASGERMSPPTRFATDKIIRNGDLVFIDIGASWNGYFGDVARTTVCGEPSKEQKEIYSAVYEAQMEGIRAMKEGETSNSVAAAYRSKAAEHGLEDNFIFLFIGHSIGISPNEPPYIGEPIPGSRETKLRAGMIFAMEPLIWVPKVRGGGGVRIEDMVLVTSAGPKVISRARYENRLLLK